MDAARRRETLFNLSGISTWVMVAVLRAAGLRETAPGSARDVAWWATAATGVVLFTGIIYLRRTGMGGSVILCTIAAALLPWLDAMHGMAFIPFSAAVVVLVHAFGWRVAAVAAVVQTVALGVVDLSFLFFGLLCGTFILTTQQSIETDRQQRELERAHAELLSTNEELRATQARLARATRDEERVRIARDLHDVIGHQLTGLALQLEVASHVTSGEAAAAVGRARSAAKDLLADVRGVVDRLRDQHADLGAELRDMAAAVPRPRVHLTTRGDLAAVDDERAEVVLRCVQEGLTNAVRHAGATAMTVEVVRGEDGDVRVAMADDGAARPGDPVRPGNGLTGMRERVESVGGTLEYGRRERGFALAIDLPGGLP